MLKPFNRAELTFDFLSEIGAEGANSTAYLAYDHQLDAQIVIKQIEKKSLDTNNFFEEAKVLYLSSHPNVVPVHYACEDVDNIYIAMPYYKKGSLNSLLNKRFLTVREIITLGCQIASGLHNIHSKKLVHFDIKPDNILLSDREEALVSDFGQSRRLNFSGVAEQDRLYTKMWPPEVFNKPEHTPAFDIYQFGLTLYRMCNGNFAFQEQFDKFLKVNGDLDRDKFKFDVRNGRFPDRSTYEEHIPQRLRRLIKKCLEPDPKDRFQAAIEVANELAQIEDKLDWKFSKLPGQRIWVRQDEGKQYKLTVDDNGKSYAEKTMDAGRTTRIAAYCKANITPLEVRRFLGET